MRTHLSDANEQKESRKVMNLQDKRPFRWKFWLLFLVAMAALFGEHQLQLSVLGHDFVQIIIVLLIYGLMFYSFNGS